MRQVNLAALICVLAVALMTAVAAERLHIHSQRVTQLGQRVNIAKEVSENYLARIKAITSARDRVGIELQAASDAYTDDIGGLAVERERLDIVRNDRAVDDSLNAAERTLGSHEDPGLFSAFQNVRTEEGHFDDSILDISTVMQEALNNPFLANGLSYNDGQQLGKRMSDSATTFRIAIDKALERFSDIYQVADNDRSAAIRTADSARSENWITSIIAP